MGRVYTVQFNNVTLAAVQDLFGLYAGVKAFALHELELGQITATAVANLRLSIKRLTTTVTAGSGGSTPTPEPVNYGDAAATVTAHANDTTQATTSGSSIILRSDVFNVINGYVYLPPREDRFIFSPSQACIITLDTTPGSIITNGTATIEELF